MNLEKAIEVNTSKLIKATSEIIRIKSVKSNPLPGMPFGKGPAMALKYMLNLAKDFGFKTKNLENYTGWAELGEGDDMIGVLVHLDVVPEGSGWTYPPYSGEIHDGKLYGRGAIDDKGPAMATLFALKTLKDVGVKLNKRVRIIFGTDEESNCECMKYYLQHDEPPTMGFSPDANYPIINVEKGILSFSFTTTFPTTKEVNGIKVLSLRGGHRANMVPDRAKTHLLGCKDKIQNTVENLGDKILGNFKVEYDNNKTIIKSYGISAHGSTPEKGKNAIMLLIKLLNEMELTQPEKDFLSFLNAAVDLDTTGKGLGVDFEDKISGRLSLNVGTMELDEYKATVRVNVRYPIKCTGEQIIKRIRENTPSFINIEDISENKPHYVPEDNPMIQKLKKAYEKVTGEEAYCFAIGGGTYARMFENCVAFGPVFPGKPELAHQTDEYIEVEDLIQNFKIYTYVLEDLAK